ncbi:LexA family transcriptional regulator [Entomobacter blattae]|uniref:HTH-type transcriptional regulator PrtR n=1 Tax=Entomobacter blattae TaxID=2762277 RepID=A0A7H1NPH5_9PROT|nr:S24 family peptidase [Entomobacter blattae]QNT77685.1 HTH-type transcriptional regulator PrtR [Entomobacter blattae]
MSHNIITHAKATVEKTQSDIQAHERVARLRQAVKNAGGNLKVAQLSGIPLSTLNSYMSGRDFKLSTAIELCKICNITIEWLATGKAIPDTTFPQQSPQPVNVHMMHYGFNPTTIQAPEGYTNIPYYKISSAVYTDIITRTNVHGYCHFQQNWLDSTIPRPPNSLLALTGLGQTMEPTLRHHDILLIDTTSTQIVDGAIYTLVVNNTILVKRLILLASGEIRLMNDNDRYPSQVISTAPTESFPLPNILGQAVWHSGLLL